MNGRRGRKGKEILLYKKIKCRRRGNRREDKKNNGKNKSGGGKIEKIRKIEASKQERG